MKKMKKMKNKNCNEYFISDSPESDENHGFYGIFVKIHRKGQ